jgi:hypothetical protein
MLLTSTNFTHFLDFLRIIDDKHVSLCVIDVICVYKGVVMAQLTVAEASQVLGITKEAIYNRIRRGSLNSVTKDGTKYVLLDASTASQHASAQTQTPQEDRYVKLLESQIDELKARAQKLETEKNQLITDKETLLRESKAEVERIYKERDKQLRIILSLIRRPALAKPDTSKSQEAIDADFEELSPYEKEMVAPEKKNQWVNLHLYLQQKGVSAKKQKKLAAALAAKVGFCEDVKEENGVLFFSGDKKLKNILTQE